MADLTNEENYFILQLDLEKLSDIIGKIVREYKKGNIKFTFDQNRAGIGFLGDVEEEFLDEFQLSEDEFEEITGDILFFIVKLMMDDKETILKKYEKDRRIEEIIAVFKQGLQEYPLLLQDLRFRSFCKTQYLENISWEISVKTNQDGVRIQLPVSVIKMSFSKPSHSNICPLSEETVVVFECMSKDLNDMIESLEKAKNELRKMEMKEGE